MPRYQNVSPLGALELPLLGRVVEPGEVVEVSDEQATSLHGQEATWQPVADPPPRRAHRVANSEQEPAQGTTIQGAGESA